MTIASVAAPRRCHIAGTELVRRWQPEGQPRAEVVLVHGIAEHTGRYERTGCLLSRAGFSVRACDLVGCGGSGGRRGDVADWAFFLEQVERLVVEARETGCPVVLLGHSMGGLIALEYALSERPGPDLLGLSAPALTGGSRWQRLSAPILARLLPRLPVPNLLKGDQLSRDPEVGERYFADPLVHRFTTTRMGAQLFEAMDRTRAAVSSLAVPTLVIHGEDDTIVEPESSQALESVECVTRRTYPGLRHELFNEPEGEDVVADVVDWIESQLSRRPPRPPGDLSREPRP